MKKMISVIVGFSLMTASAITMATNKTEDTAKAAQAIHVKAEQAAKKEIQTQKIDLYAAPEKDAKILAKFDLSQRLIPFFHKDGWLKVGDPGTGKVGWINKKQYQEAQNKAFQASSQMIYMQVKQSDDNKPEIIAYKNGEKLSPEAAKKLYKRIKQQQALANRQFQHMQMQINKDFVDTMAELNAAFQMPAMPIMQPIIIIDNNKSKKD